MKGKAGPGGDTRTSRRVGVVTVTLAAITLAAAGTVLWLALAADTTIARLRAEADKASLYAELELPAPDPNGGAERAGIGLDVSAADSQAASTSPQGGDAGPSRVALAPTPIPDLVEDSEMGPLPRIAPDGRAPWQAYARPFDRSDARPRIAIVITDMGHANAATNTAIRRLPAAVTLAFTPYASDLDAWLMAARAGGHETLMMVPMEPETYPRDDPGPHTLLTSLGPAANRQRLEWVLSRAAGYVGVVAEMGSRFTLSEEALAPVLATLGSRGLLFLDNGAAAGSKVDTVAGRVGLPRVLNHRVIDAVTDRDTIDLRLQELEDIAREQGFAVGLAHPYPLTFERLAAWFPTLERKGIVLAPITAVADRRTAG